MTRTAVVFAGQGERGLLPCVEALLASDRRASLESLAGELGYSGAELVARGGRLLERTEILQPVQVLLQGVLYESVASAIDPEWVLGHSLGELCAWTVATGTDWSAAVALARLRGARMAEVAASLGGGMVAVGDEWVEAALATGRRAGAVTIALKNRPHETILSGDEAALEAIARIAPARRLKGLGPWHGPWFLDVAGALRDAVRAGLTQVGRLSRPKFVAGARGEICETCSAANDWIAAQVASPVDWCRALSALASVEEIVIVGPSDAQAFLIHENLGRRVRVRRVERLPPMSLSTSAGCA